MTFQVTPSPVRNIAWDVSHYFSRHETEKNQFTLMHTGEKESRLPSPWKWLLSLKGEEEEEEETTQNEFQSWGLKRKETLWALENGERIIVKARAISSHLKYLKRCRWTVFSLVVSEIENFYTVVSSQVSSSHDTYSEVIDCLSYIRVSPESYFVRPTARIWTLGVRSIRRKVTSFWQRQKKPIERSYRPHKGNFVQLPLIAD